MFNTGLGSFGEPEDFAGRVYTAPGTNTTQVPAGNQQQVGGLTPAQQAHQNEDLAIVPNGNDKPVVGGTVPVGGGTTTPPPATTTTTPPPDTSQVDALNAQIAELQGQLDTVNADLVSANDRFNTAQTEFDQTLADQEAQFLADQEAALTAQKETMLAERAGLLEGQQTQFDEAKAGWTAEKETAVQEAVARVQAEAEANLANLEAQMQEQINAKMSEIDQLQQTLTDVQKQVAEAKAEADGYKSQVRSQFDQSVYDEADKRYRGLLDEEQGVLEQLRQKEAEHDVLINEAATTFDDAVNASMNRIQDYDLVVRGGILDDAVNTYTAPTDIAAQHAELATAAGQVGDQAQTLANTQGNIFSELVATGGGGNTGGGNTGGEDVDPTEDVAFVSAVRNPDVEGGYEAPVDQFYPQVGSGYQYGGASGVPYSEIYGHSWDGFGGRDSRMPSDGGGLDWGKAGSAAKWLVGQGLPDLAKKVGDLTLEGLKFHPLYGGLMSRFMDEQQEPASKEYPFTEGVTTDYGGYGGGYAAEDQAETDRLVAEALGIDVDELLKTINETNTDVAPEITAAYAQVRADRAAQADHARKIDTHAGGYGLGGYRYGSRDDPSSGWGNRTPHLSSNRDEMFATGRVGISGRMLPSAGKGFGGENPFAPGYTPPQPGDPGYADHLVDSMGFDPQRMEEEINKMVEQDMPFWTSQDEQGNTVMVDKQTGQVTVLDNAEQNQAMNEGPGFIGAVAGSGSGMNLGGLVSSHLMPLKY